MSFRAQDLYPETIADALKLWDEGEAIWSIELGGLGPSYEQAIQVGVIELCRKIQDKELPEDDEVNDFLDEHLFEVIDECEHLGLSGAQAAAIKSVSYQFKRDGWRATLQRYPSDRRMQISKQWPRRKEETKESGK